jgi:hypothetical protein
MKIEVVNKRFCILAILFGLCSSIEVWAQIRESKQDAEFCIPSIIGLPRTKGIEFKQERVTDFSMLMFRDGIPVESSEVRRNKRTEFKIKAHIINKQGFKLAGGLKYFQENFSFENIEETNNEFFQSLNDKPLRSLGATLYAVKPFRGNTFLLVRFNAALNGDWSKTVHPTREYLKFTISPLYGFKLSESRSLAFGVSFGYNFGRKSILPIFSYNETFNRNWGLESILPAKVKARYTTNNQKTVFYAGVEGQGTNYNLTLSNLQDRPLYLNNTEVRAMFTVEREIHDWLWIGMEAGYRKNLDFSLELTPQRGGPRVADSRLNDAFVMNFSVFMVPPRRFYEKNH